MATDIPMEDAPPVTTVGTLEPPSVVEQWTPNDLFDYTPIKKILWNEKNRATFWNAEISGNAFLLRGDDVHFWMDVCQLPAGPSVELADLAQTIKNMGKDESRGNVFHLGSVEPANTFTVESPSPPGPWIVQIARLKFLHGLLWGKGDSLCDTVLCEFEHPSWNRDTNSHERRKETSRQRAEEPSLYRYTRTHTHATHTSSCRVTHTQYIRSSHVIPPRRSHAIHTQLTRHT